MTWAGIKAIFQQMAVVVAVLRVLQYMGKMGEELERAHMTHRHLLPDYSVIEGGKS